jgi:hypothetical protein
LNLIIPSRALRFDAGFSFENITHDTQIYTARCRTKREFRKNGRQYEE